MQSKNHRPVGMNHSNSNFRNLTSDLILEILLRLPVKALIRFCTVCTSWKTLIRSEDFIKSHLKQSLQYNSVNSNKVLIYSEAEFRKNHLWDVSQLPYFFFAGSSNGLLCYYSKSWNSNSIIVHLWNPATRTFRSLPEGYYRNGCNKRILVLFTFDLVHDDYKVVKILFRRHQTSLALKGEVFSLRTDSWKTMNLSSWSIRRWVGSNIVVHNGALYCITFSTSTRQIVLGMFNIDEEWYDEIAIPCTNFKKKPMASLRSFKEFLSLSIWREEFEVWVMKEYGVWTKQFVLANSPLAHSPYGITGNGKLLAVNWNGEDVLYDADKQTIEKYVDNKVIFLKENVNYSMPEMDHVVVVDFVESMVSIFPPTEETSEPNALTVFTSI